MDFELTVPSTLKSGLYAARLSSGEEEEYIPSHALVLATSMGKHTDVYLLVCEELLANKYKNNVSRITKNVLDRFLDHKPFVQ